MKKLLVCSIAIAMMLAFGAGAQALPIKVGLDSVAIDDGGIGDVLLFSLYDVRDNVEDRSPRSEKWENYLAIENTSGAWTAFHLRFRAWKKSIEVWDHVILLSPYDVFWMILQKDDKGVKLFSADTETLHNSALAWGNDLAWTDYFSSDLIEKNGFCEGLGQECLNNEMQAGYVEAIGLWQLSIPPKACGLDPDQAGLCLEDVHDIDEVVNDVNKFVGPGGVGGINVWDIQDALFFDFWKANYFVNNNGSCNYGPFGACVAVNVGGYTIDSGWPARDDIDIDGDPDKGCAETSWDCGPGYDERDERVGVDCGNVLTGVFFMTDEDTGRFQMENFIALENFRTDLGNVHGSWEEMYYSYSLRDNPLIPEVEIDIVGGDAADFGLQDAVTQNEPFWRHRDGFEGGGIFFPASVADWYYGWSPALNVRYYAGGDEFTYLWYYTHPNWATVAGPTLVDGDDFIGINWNDAQLWLGFKPWFFPTSNVPVDYYGYLQPLGDKGPLNWEAFSGSTGYFVHYFNDVFSLDDVEVALGKGSIWYTHWRTDLDQGANQNLFTDVVLTYPTKHHHWFFGDWPLMWRAVPEWLDPMNDNMWEQYIENVTDYRGDQLPGGLKDVEEMILTDGKDISNINDYNQDGYTIAEWYEMQYENGKLRAGSYMWDMDQRICGGTPPDGPPPSPVPPIYNPTFIPHEVNLIRVGATEDVTQIGLGDAWHLLTCASDPDWKTGHWMISTTLTEKGQRGIGQAMFPFSTYITPSWIPFNEGVYVLPPIGVVIVSNDLGVGPVTRSAMAEWHYTTWGHWLYSPLTEGWTLGRGFTGSGAGIFQE